MRLIKHSVGKNCKPVRNDIRTVQCLLNLSANRQLSGTTAPKLEINGVVDEPTLEAIRLFQSKVLKMKQPDERVDPGGGMMTRLTSALPQLPTGAYSEPAWLRIAYQEEQDAPKEKKGLDDNNERILEYLSTASNLASLHVKVPLLKDGKPVFTKRGQQVMTDGTQMMSEVDETAWCACFVNWCLQQAGERPIPGAKAEGYKRWGGQASIDHIGAICVIKRDPFEDSPGTGWHVGFFIGGSSADGYVALLGGNQRNTVCRKWFVGIDPGPETMFLRWPRAH